MLSGQFSCHQRLIQLFPQLRDCIPPSPADFPHRSVYEMTDHVKDVPNNLVEDRIKTLPTADGQPSQQFPSESTHSRARHTSTVDDHLRRNRAAVFRELGPVPIAPDEVFEKFLPRPPVDSLSIESSFAPSTWDRWPNEPTRSEGDGNTVFETLSSLINDIIETASKRLRVKATAYHIHNPTFAPFSNKSNSSQPDGYFALVPEPGGPTQPTQLCWPYALLKHALDDEKGKSQSPCDCSCGINWEDIGCPWEYNKDDNDKSRADVRK